MTRRFTILVALLALLVQSLVGHTVRPTGRDSGCERHAAAAAKLEHCACCCKETDKTPDRRDEDACPCPRGCVQCFRSLDGDRTAPQTHRAVARKTQAVRPAERPLPSLSADADLALAPVVPTAERGDATPVHLLALRTTVIVV